MGGRGWKWEGLRSNLSISQAASWSSGSRCSANCLKSKESCPPLPSKEEHNGKEHRITWGQGICSYLSLALWRLLRVCW